MKNLITSIAVILLLLGGLFYFGRGERTAALPVDSQVEAGSLLTSADTEYDFGIISMKDGVVKKSFKISNETDKDVRIDSVVTSCMCTTAYLVKGSDRKGPFGMPGHGLTVPRANEVLAAGEEREVEVVFDPAAHGPEGVGIAERLIYIVDETGGALELKISAEVTL